MVHSFCHSHSPETRRSLSQFLPGIITSNPSNGHSSRSLSILPLYVQRRGTELSRYKTRSAILQHTLEKKQNESILLKQKLIILQDVIQRLQKSNKSLLEKLECLQQEKEGVHTNDNNNNKDSDSDVVLDVWPPDMQLQLLKDEFDAKEVQWKKALRIGHAKYLKAKEENRNLTQILEERDRDIQFYFERAKVDESENNLLREQINIKENIIQELEKEVKEIQGNLDKAGLALQEYDQQGNATVLSQELLSAQKKIKVQEKQLSVAKLRLEKLGNLWKSRREEMQQIIVKKSQDLVNLREQNDRLAVERDSLEAKLRQVQEELYAITNATKLELIEEQNMQQKALGMESLEIAVAAVKQSEERERELREDLNHALKEKKEAKDQVKSLQKKLQEVMEEKRIASVHDEASRDYMSIIDALKLEIADLNRKLIVPADTQLLQVTLDPEFSLDVVPTNLTLISSDASDNASLVHAHQEERHGITTPKLKEIAKNGNTSRVTNSYSKETEKKGNSRFHRLVRRVKSIWRRSKDVNHS